MKQPPWERFQNVASGQFCTSGNTNLLNWPFVNVKRITKRMIQRKFSGPSNNFGRSFCDKIAIDYGAKIIANVINIECETKREEDGGDSPKWEREREKSKKYDSSKTAGDKKNDIKSNIDTFYNVCVYIKRERERER